MWGLVWVHEVGMPEIVWETYFLFVEDVLDWRPDGALVVIQTGNVSVFVERFVPYRELEIVRFG